ncbi:hypothetical protein WJX79_005184 [Trebouxia sp. C0005]
MTMTSAETQDVVDLTQDEEDCDELVARVGRSSGLGAADRQAADQQAAEAAQVLGSDASGAHVQPRRPPKLQWAQHLLESHVQQATSAQQQQQQAHVCKSPLAQYQTPSQPRVPAPNLTDPALHLLDHTFMMDALSVLTHSQAAAHRSDQPGFASLDVRYMQLLSQAQAVDQGRLLVFLEWLTVKMCQRGLCTAHMALVNDVLLSCQAAKGGVLITIMALTSMAAHRAPGYVPEYVRVIQGRQPEYEALAMFPWLQPIQAGGNFTTMQYLKFSPSGAMSHSNLANHMKHKPYMCINPIYLEQCNDAELRSLSANGLLRNSGLQQNQAWLSELSRKDSSHLYVFGRRQRTSADQHIPGPSAQAVPMPDLSKPTDGTSPAAGAALPSRASAESIWVHSSSWSGDSVSHKSASAQKHTGMLARDASGRFSRLGQQGVDSGEEDKVQVDQQEGDSIKSERQGQEVACSAPNLMSMLLPKPFVKAVWALDLYLSEVEQQGYKSILEDAFVLVRDRDQQHLVQVKACHPDHNMQPVFTIQNGEEVRFEELSDAVHFEAHHVRLHQVAIITGKLPRLLLDEVAHANMEARIEQSVAYFELQEQLKQAGLDTSTQQALTEEITLLTSQIMSRPSDAIYSRIDEDWKTQEEETRSFFIKLCGSKADEALAEAKQSPAAKQEPATVADTAVPDQQAIASKLVSAKPLDQPQAPSSATSPQPHIAPPLDQHDAQAATALQEDAAPPVDQEDLLESAGMGHVGKWQEIIRVDDGEGVPGIAIGHWLKEAKRNGLKRTGGRPQAAKATAASPKEADPLDVAISAYPEASPSGQQQANVKSPAGSERATDAETSPNKKAAESQAGTKNLFKHKHKPGIACLACNEAKRQKRIQRQAQLTQDGSIPQGEASPTEGVPDAKAGRANRPDGQHGGAAIAAVTENGQISSGAAEGSAWVPVELDFGEKPTSPFSKAAAQQHLKLGSGNKAPKLASTAQLHSSSKSTKSSQVSKPSVGRPPKLDSLSTTNSAGKGSAEAAGPGLEAGADVSVKAGVGTKPGVTLLIKGHKGSLPGVSHPQCSSNADSAADGGDAGTSPSNGLRSPKSPSSPTSPSRKSAVTSHKHVSSAAVLSHDLGQTPSEKVASPTNPSSQPAPALSKKVSSPPSPAPVSALTSPEKVSSPPDPAAATIAPQPSVTGDTRDKGVSPMQEVALISKMDLNTGAQPQRKLGMKRKRSTEAAACDGAAKKSSANFGGLSIVPLPKAKPSPPEGHLIEEQMDEDQPYWAGRNAPHLPSWPGPHGAAEAEPWSTNRVGRCWAGAGYTDTPLNSMLMRSVFMGTLKSEGSLGTSAWQSALREWWDGNLVVFTLPGEVAANCLQAATASMNLARVVKLLRNGQPLITNLSVAQAGGHSVCKQHVARLWLTRPRGVTDTLLDMLSQEAKASLEEVVPGLLQKRDDAKRSYMIGLITLTGGTA